MLQTIAVGRKKKMFTVHRETTTEIIITMLRCLPVDFTALEFLYFTNVPIIAMVKAMPMTAITTNARYGVLFDPIKIRGNGKQLFLDGAGTSNF